MSKKRVLTGDRPTGRLHLGHYVGSLKNRLALQEECEQFVMIADVQALTDNAQNPQKVHDAVMEVMLDYLAVGLDPAKTTFFIQSQIPHIAELTVFFLNLVTVSRLEQNPTVKTEIRDKGYERNIPAGFLVYPVSQAADILIVRPDAVPVGEDQLPMIEQTNEIVDRFNNYYPAQSPVFKKVEAMVPKDISARLPGTDGQAKASKSLGNAIYLSDSPDEIKKKVNDMYTDPTHIKKEDPGKVEGNVVFTYLDLFDEDQAGLATLKENYQKGGVGDTEVKERLVNVLETFLAPIRARREELSKNPEALVSILRNGGARVREEGEETMRLVREAMKINYF
jgi:tryptophanyl-tRNA synthetase